MTDQFQLKALITGVDQLSPVLTGIRQNIAQFRKHLKRSRLGKSISFGELVTGGALAAPLIAGVRAAITFESAMAEVRKTVNFETPQQFQHMRDDILDASTHLPMAADGIALIAAAGGQAGIARQELKGFSVDAVKMGIAFDLTAEQAGGMMATWRTAFKMNQDEVVTLADKINYLGNTGPASADKIASIVTRLGPVGEVAGVASDQIAAIGATLVGVGVQEDVASTGLKNFMLTLTAGASATAQQQKTFKALRLDAKQLAADMQIDPKGAMLRVLKGISQVDKEKQAGVLTQLIGRESVQAIAPLLTNFDLLQSNLHKVSDATHYAGSMAHEYAARVDTTANAIQLFTNRITALGINVGTILLPAINEFLFVIGPLINQVGTLSAFCPWLIKGVVGAAIGFTVLRLAVLGSTLATKAFLAVSKLTPVGIAMRVIALAAGALLANWSSVAPFFKSMWQGIVKCFEWGWSFIQTFFNCTPLGWVIRNWEPIVGWFKNWWEQISPYIQPLIDGAGWIGQKMGAFFTVEGEKREGADDSSEHSAMSRPLTMPPLPNRQHWAHDAAAPLGSSALAGYQANTAKLNGELVVRFENAPADLRVEPLKTNQSRLRVTQRVGYRTLGGAY